jgi:quercetin dioxygenase-like cupin family protein
LLVPLTRQLQIRIDDLVPAEPPDPRIRQSEVHRHGLLVVPLAPSHAPIQTYKITYPPVANMPSLRTHDGYEWLYVLQGRLRIQLGEREFVLNRGEAAEFDTRTPHALAATGGRSCQVISIFNEDGARIHTKGVA